MAFAYRSPVESVLTKLTSEEQSRISSTAISSIHDREKDTHQHFNFALSDFAKQKLSEAGIYLSPFSYVPHSHPVCKTVENHILLNVLPTYIDNSFYVVSMKEKKLEYLRARSKMPTLQCLNRFVDSKDISRYGIRRYFESGKKKGIFDPQVDFSDSNTLRDLVPLALLKKARSLLLHDELHYWSPKDLDRFLCATKCDILVGTFVFPTEIFLGTEESFNPWMYTFRIEGDTLSFFPDGVMSEGYQQPLSSAFLLTINEFITSAGDVYSVDVVYSLFSHCVIQISKGRVAHKKQQFFSGFNASFIPQLNHFGGDLPEVIGVRPALIKKIYLYLRTLKKPDFESSMAKLRQMVDEPSGTEIIFFESFSKFVLNHKVYGKGIEQGFLDSLSDFFIDCLPNFFRRYFESACKRDLSLFIEKLEEAFVIIDLGKVDMTEGNFFSFKNLVELINFLFPGRRPKKSDSERLIDVEKKKISLGRRSRRYASIELTEPITLLYGINWKRVAATYNYCSHPEEIVRIFQVASRMFLRGVSTAEIVAFILHPLPVSDLRSRRFVEDFLVSSEQCLAFFILNVLNFSLDAFHSSLNLGVIEKSLFLTSQPFDDFTSCERLRRDRQTLFNQGERLRKNEEERKKKSSSEAVGCGNKEEAVTSVGASNKESTMDVTGTTSVNVVADEHEGGTEELVFEEDSFLDFEEPFKKNEQPEMNPTASSPMKESMGFAVASKEGKKTERGEVVEVINLCCGKKISISEAKETFEHLIFPDHLKGRVAAFYSRAGDSYFYGNIMHESMGWFPKLDEFLRSNGFTPEIFDHCLIQKYSAGGSIGFHADDEKCYPADNPILTVNVSGKATFKIMCSHAKEKKVTTFPIEGRMMFLMDKGMQVTHKHAVEAIDERVSMTFRSTKSIHFLVNDNGCVLDGGSFFTNPFARVAFGASCYPAKLSMSHAERFNLFAVAGDGNCFWHAISTLIGGSVPELKDVCENYCAANNFVFPEQMFLDRVYSEDEAILIASAAFDLKLIIFDTLNDAVFEVKPVGRAHDKQIFLFLEHEHFSVMIPKEGCVIRALSKAFDRDESQILSILAREEHSYILSELMEGEGLPYPLLEKTFKIFGLKATVHFSNSSSVFNANGLIERVFTLKDGHLEFVREAAEGEKYAIGKEKSLKVTRDIPALVKMASGDDLISYQLSVDRAKTLEESFLAGSSGKILTQTFSNQKAWVKNDACQRKVQIGLCIGTFGSGKSYAAEHMIKNRQESHFLIISPRRRLAEMFKAKLNVKKGWKSGKKNNVDVLTFEVALKKKVSKETLVIFDELQLFPPGYLDLFLLHNKEINELLVLGDPCQSSYDTDQDRYIFDGIDNDLVNILKNENYQFCVCSRRFRNSFFNGRLPALLHEIENYPELVYGVLENFKKDLNFIMGLDAILCSSFAEKKALAYILKDKVEVLTFGESTGLTFSRGAIYLTQDVRVVDQKRILVALSRFSEEINFINVTGEDFHTFMQSMPNSLLFKFCAKKACIEDIKELLPGKPTLVLKKKIGKDETDREERCVGDPWLKTMIFLGNRVDVLEVELPGEVDEMISCKSHHPLVPVNYATAINYDRMRLRESREVRLGDTVSEQFRDEYFVKDYNRVSNQCDLFEAIYPRHKGSDTVTFLMAVRKRLVFSNPAVNAQKYRAALPFGKLMFEVFIRRIPLRHELNQFLLEEALNDFESKKLEKSIATITNHAMRSNRDWDIKEAFIFMKSQLCTKFDNRFRDAKAGQTLACFSHIVLVRFAPWIRYIEKKVLEVLPANIYIHSGKNFDALKEWVQAADFSGECTESDYEAFDASQDATILAFEVEVMKFLGVPSDVIKDYEFIKMNLYSRLGLFSVMRFTGEAGTFLFNTLANMCFTFMRYDLNGSESIAFAGDDMCANKRLKVTRNFDNVLERLKLKAKVEIKREASFCGWTLGSFGIWKKPQLVFERLQIAKERGTLDDCIDNYAIEISYGYELGDEIFEYMTEEEACYQQMCVREVIMNKNRLKSNVGIKFEGKY